jgi:hypothetical protein
MIRWAFDRAARVVAVARAMPGHGEDREHWPVAVGAVRRRGARDDHGRGI